MIVPITHKLLVKEFTEIVSETNGITIIDTLDLLISSSLKNKNSEAYDCVFEFKNLLNQFITNEKTIHDLLKHPFAKVLSEFFTRFPLKYKEEHIHLTGSLTADFIWEKLKMPMAQIHGPYNQLKM